MSSARTACAAFDSGRLELIIFSTEQCNFRCTYCYEDFSHGRLHPHVAEGIKRLIDRRCPELHTLELSWFGGEPLLARDTVIDLARHATDACLRHDTQLRSHATTNGYYLDVDTVRRLVDVGVSHYHISIDGPAEQHDRTRRKATGAGTFARIWDNLKALQASDLEFSVLLRVHATSANQRALPELVQQLNECFGDDPRYSAYLKRVGRLGGANDHELDVIAPDAEKVLAESLQESLAPGLRTDAPGGDSYVCYAAQPNSLAIRADGTIAKCTVALRDDRNRLGRIGADGRIELDQTKMRRWIRGFASQDSEDLACPLSGLPDEVADQSVERSHQQISNRETL